jgi:hypothetical protein
MHVTGEKRKQSRIVAKFTTVNEESSDGHAISDGFLRGRRILSYVRRPTGALGHKVF